MLAGPHNKVIIYVSNRFSHQSKGAGLQQLQLQAPTLQRLSLYKRLYKSCFINAILDMCVRVNAAVSRSMQHSIYTFASLTPTASPPAWL